MAENDIRMEKINMVSNIILKWFAVAWIVVMSLWVYGGMKNQNAIVLFQRHKYMVDKMVADLTKLNNPEVVKVIESYAK